MRTTDQKRELIRADDVGAMIPAATPAAAAVVAVDPVLAAGVLFVALENKALFLKRAPTGDHPGEWCFPGGSVEGDETPDQAARRETREETGHEIDGDLSPWVKKTTMESAPPLSPELVPGAVAIPNAAPRLVEFHTFIKHVPAEFEVKLDAEHVAYAWVPMDSPPEPLHPGCRLALAKLGMDELELARAMVAGDLPSPQRYRNMTLFDLRITGTGTAYRPKSKEFVYRRPEHYLNADFLARCNGLAVIMMHPDNDLLDSKEFSARTVGSMMLPYVGDGVRHPSDEVWGIAKIYDDDAVGLMLTAPMSTSPAVVLTNSSDENFKLKLENGETLLIEGKPKLVDHLAICEHGVWDKGDEPSGVNSELIRGDSGMANEEETKKADDKPEDKVADKKADAKADAKADEGKAEDKKADADGGAPLDKILKGIDAMNARMDNFGARMDSFEKKADAKADAAGDDEKDKDAKKADESDKDKDEKKSDAKADDDVGVAMGDIRNRISEVERKLPRTMTDAEHIAMTEAQARADDVFNLFGKRAPRPLDGEDLVGYRLRVASALKTHSAAWKEVDLKKIAADDTALKVAERQIYADATVAAQNPVDIAAGELRMVETNRGGITMRSFYGPNTFIAAMKRPARHVTAFARRGADGQPN